MANRFRRFQMVDTLLNQSSKTGRSELKKQAKLERKRLNPDYHSSSDEDEEGAYDGLNSYNENNVYSTTNTQYFVSPLDTVS
eukprot:gene29516-36582_t